MAHIGLELLLDHLLIEKNLIQTEGFYHAFEEADKGEINEFLVNAGLEDTSIVMEFIARFTSSKYLLSYQKIENISYALNRICMRIWADCLQQDALAPLTAQLEEFKISLQTDFIKIFEEIETSLD
ncbi:MAG: DUF479 domain-containing protein [Pedobacter sp.]|nr:MAG: DUF479 domain-containing protein [Pedobacter sp.]